MIVITSRFSGVKYFRATRWTSAWRDVHEDVELAVGGLDVVVDDGGVAELSRLVLVRLAAEHVVARELVLRLLQLRRA